MLLSYVELVELVARGVMENVAEGAINAASIDVRLGDSFRFEDTRINSTVNVVDLSKRESVQYISETIPDGEVAILRPAGFVLAHTMEKFNLPNNISAQFLLKSSVARNGLDHLSATWCDAGWHGSVLTLELRNVTQMHNLLLRPGMFIGQMKFYRHTPVPEEQSYGKRGRYNNDESVSEIKL